MRRLVLAMIVMIPVLAFATLSTAYQVELLPNGGFETGTFNSWQIIPGEFGATASVQSTVVDTGRYAAELSSIGHASPRRATINHTSIGQVLNIPAGTPLSLSFALNTNVSPHNRHSDIEIDLIDANNQNIFSSIYNDLPSNTWSTFSSGPIMDGTAAITYLLISATYQKPNPSMRFYVDNVSLQQLDPSPRPVPIPSTMLLLGSGLIGLVGLRKKFKK